MMAAELRGIVMLAKIAIRQALDHGQPKPAREGRQEIHGNAMTAVGTKLTPTSYLKASGNV